jgi:signal transduction histidine kinase
MALRDDAAAQAEANTTERAFVRRILASLVAGFLILAAVVVAAGWLLLRAQDFNFWVDHTYRVETETAQFQILLEQAEAARRGYLLTGDERYRVTFERAVSRTGPVAQDLRQLTTDNPRQQARIGQLETLLKAKRAVMEASIQARSAAGLSGSAATFRTSVDQGFLNDLRAITTQMADEERRLLAERSAQAGRNAELLLVVVLLAGVLLAMVAFASSWVMRRYANQLARSQADLRRLNEGLEDAVKVRTLNLSRANEEIQRFAYIVSHDLRSPLVNIMGFTSELEAASKPLREMLVEVDERAPGAISVEARAAVETDLPESIGFIRASTQKMDRLISAILRLSREGRRVLAPEPLDMNRLVDGIIQATRTSIDERAADVAIEGRLPDIVSDRVAVEQIFSNLVENALKYLKPGRLGRIVVRGRAEAGRVVYEVEDNGRGIAPKDHERIFDLFRRAGVQDQPGEGIGLAHVRALVYRLNGLIDCVSALDQGALFRVSLPRVLVREEGELS